VHPRLEDADDADIDFDTHELVEPAPEEPLGYGHGEWASGPFRPRHPEGGLDETCAVRWPRTRGYQRTDEPIYEDLCDRLTVNSHIDASDIEVNVRDGEVTPRGHVPTRETRRLAEDVAFGIRGVRHVSNDLCVPADTTDR
jgi:BON domain